MSPESMLVLGCLGLGMVIAYTLWASVRVTLLQLDLRKIICDLDDDARASGTIDDPYYHMTREFVNLIILAAPYFSLPVALLFLKGKGGRRGEGRRRERWTREQSTTVMTHIADWSKALPPGVRDAWLRVLVRLVVHFASSPVDLAILMVMHASGQSERLISWVTTPWQDLAQFGRYDSLYVGIPTKAV